MNDMDHKPSAMVHAPETPKGAGLDGARVRGEREFRVKSLRRLSMSTYEVSLAPVGTTKVDRYPGQYIELLAPNGHRVPFSIANAPTPEDKDIELHIACAEKGSTSHSVLQELRTHGRARVYGPKGETYARPPSTSPLVLVASGTGFAQSKAMIEAELGSGSDAPLFLYWKGNRNTGIYMRDLVQEWSSRWANFGYIARGQPQGMATEAQVCAQEVTKACRGHAQYDIVVSGSAKFVSEIVAAFTSLGVPRRRIHSDLLAPGAVLEASNGG